MANKTTKTARSMSPRLAAYRERVAARKALAKQPPKPPTPAAKPVLVVTPPAPILEKKAPQAPATPAPAPSSTHDSATSVTFKESSTIVAASLDVKAQLVEVTFKNGAKHTFGNFTAELLADWYKADSAGKWFHANIRQQPTKHPQITAPLPAPTLPPPGVPVVESKPVAPAGGKLGG